MADLTDIGCCSCFSFLWKPSVPVPQHRDRDADGILSEDLLKRQSAEDPDGSFYTGNDPDISFYNGDDLDRSFYNADDPDRSFYDRDDTDYLEGSDDGPPRKSSEDIIQSRAQNGFACREIPVKETKKVFRSEDENGNKMVNQYVHLGKIGSGSYGKVVLYRNVKDGKLYAVKVLNKPYMMKVRVVRAETAMTDVLREDDDDMLWRSPGTPVFTAPECCQGSAYHGRASDTWAVGVTLYCMIFGNYPFLGDTLQETYDKIANDPVQIPDDMNPQLADLLTRLLCKDPGDRITLQAAAEHPWVAGHKGPVPEFMCRCGFGRRKRNELVVVQ